MIEELLQQSVGVLAAAVVVVYLSAKLRVPSVVGLIVTGVLIGPSGLGLVHEVEQVEVFAEIGVVLLLFTIGLELSFAQIREMGRPFFLGGGLQAGATLALAAAAVATRGTSLGKALFLGFVVALSSTAVVLQLYGQRRETATPQGRVVLAVLLFQDLLIVPMIVLTPILAGRAAASPAEIALQFAVALAAVATVFVVARFLMPRLLERLVNVRVRELSVLTALLVCLAMAWFTSSLGFSLALGAFIAGLLVSETDYGHQLTADVAPFRDLFASVFFVSIGMLVDLPFALDRPLRLLGLAALLVAGKALVAAVAVRVVGYPTRVAVIAALGLAQVGEFSFVLMEVGREHGLLGETGFQTMLVASVLTLIVTPFLIAAAPRVGEEAAALLPAGDDRAAPPPEELRSHVVVIGYGMNGRLMARVLGEARIPFVVVELNPELAQRARRDRVPVLFGDAARREILDHAGVARAQVMVVAISDRTAVRRTVQVARHLAPGLEIVVRSRMVQEIDELRSVGANHVVAEEFETAIEIFTLVLERFHVPRNVIRAQTRVLRGESYRMLRASAQSPAASAAVLDALEAGTTDLYRIAPESRVAGRTLRDLDLRRRTGGTVIAVVRGETSYVNPSPTIALDPGDCLVLVGSHEEIDAAFRFLDERSGEPQAV